jgi:hypothetical protein
VIEKRKEDQEKELQEAEQREAQLKAQLAREAELQEEKRREEDRLRREKVGDGRRGACAGRAGWPGCWRMGDTWWPLLAGRVCVPAVLQARTSARPARAA